MPYLNGPHMFIAYEGIDGAGKTTLAKALASAIGGTYCATPPPALAGAEVKLGGATVPLRRHIEELGHIPSRMLFYLLSTAYACNEISELLKGGHVVCDKYVGSTLAYHAALEPALRDFKTDGLSLLKPDLTFHLRVSRAERVRRASQRVLDDKSNSGWFDGDCDFLARVDAEYERLGYLHLMTDGYTVEELVQISLHCLQLRVREPVAA